MSAAKASMSKSPGAESGPPAGAKVMTPPTCIARVRSSANRKDASSGERRSGTPASLERAVSIDAATRVLSVDGPAAEDGTRDGDRRAGTVDRRRGDGDAVLGAEPARRVARGDLGGGPECSAHRRPARRVVVAGGAALDAAGRGAAARDGGGHDVRAALDRRRLHEPAGGGPHPAAGRRRPARARRGRRRPGGA